MKSGIGKIFGLLICVYVLILTSGFGPYKFGKVFRGNRHKEAIENVLDKDHEIGLRFEKAIKSEMEDFSIFTSFGKVGRLSRSCYRELARIDVTGCPEDFVCYWRRYINIEDEGTDYFSNLSFFSYLWNKSEIERTLKNLVEKGENARRDMLKCAKKYGVNTKKYDD